MIRRRTVACLGLSQLINWGVTYYLIGGFATRIGAETGWTPTVVHGGFSAALLVMGLSSGTIGRLIDRHGGRPVMAAGSILGAAGCLGLALAHDLATYYAAWLCLGLAMRCTLYDAAFAALARAGGPAARRPMAQITLLGGLASTTFWPIGDALANAFGWRGALVAYAGFAILTLPLHLTLPAGQYGDGPAGRQPAGAPLAHSRHQQWIAGGLYALIATLANVLNAGMSAHMIGILAGLGLAAPMAVWVATLRGVGQSSARLGEILFGSRLPPLSLNLAAAAVLPVCFALGLFAGAAPAAAFAFLYGAGNGLLTITRGTVPLVLFDHRQYGTVVGRLLGPSFLCAAAAPVAYAAIIEHLGPAAALFLSGGLALVAVAAAAGLVLAFRR